MRRTAAASVALMVIAAACGGPPMPSASPNAPVSTPTATPAATPTATASATPAATDESEACPFPVGIADVPYAGLADYASRGASAVGIAEVVDVGPVQYATESGSRPSCDELAAGSHGPVGRLIRLRITMPVAGDAQAGRIVSYMLPGGAIGGDVSVGHHWNLEAPQEGDSMLVLLMEEPIDLDGGAGVLEQHALDLFAISEDGRILTPNPDENVTVDSVAMLLDLLAD